MLFIYKVKKHCKGYVLKTAHAWNRTNSDI